MSARTILACSPQISKHFWLTLSDHEPPRSAIRSARTGHDRASVNSTGTVGCGQVLPGFDLCIGRDAHVSNQLPFGSAMNRYHDVQRETRAHDLV